MADVDIFLNMAENLLFHIDKRGQEERGTNAPITSSRSTTTTTTTTTTTKRGWGGVWGDGRCG